MEKVRKSKIFSSVNLILITLLVVELIFLANSVGMPQNGKTILTENNEDCFSSQEICDGLDNDCDLQIDEGDVCKIKEPEFNGYIVELKDDPVSKYYLNQKNNNALAKTSLQESVNSYRKTIDVKQKDLEVKIKNKVPKVKINSQYQNVFNGFAVFDISGEEAKQLESLPEVKRVYPNYEVHTMLMDSVPLINADDVWLLDSDGNPCSTSGKFCLTGQGIKIGIIDTGVDYTHPDLGGCFGSGCKVVGGYDFYNNDANPMDDQGHGTHVAATAAGKGVLNGVAPGATIYSYKVLSAGGSGTSNTIISAIERSADPNQDGDFSDHLDIISMSLGGYGNSDDPMSLVIDNVVDIGVVAVIAAGNSGPNGGPNCRHEEDLTGLFILFVLPELREKQ